MSTLSLVTDADATNDQAEALASVQQALGTIPNLTRAMVHSPALLRGYLGLAGALDRGTLPGSTRERLAIAIAQANGCSYCLSGASRGVV